MQVIERILLAYMDNIKAGVPMAAVFASDDAAQTSAVEPPSTLLWLLLLASKVTQSPAQC
jgi:hypothetical protein